MVRKFRIIDKMYRPRGKDTSIMNVNVFVQTRRRYSFCLRDNVNREAS